jgi:prepilin-type N-terminal cleavage/methylation domain-containing protein
MKNKGFTLIEVLAVIIIIAVVLLVIVPVTMDIITNSKQEAYNRTIDNVKRAAETYFTDDKTNLAQIDIYNGSNMVTIQDLINYGLLQSEIKDPRDNTTIPSTAYVVVSLTSDGDYSYSFKNDTGISSINLKSGAAVRVQDSIYIAGINPGTTEAQLLSQFNKGYYLKIYNGSDQLISYSDLVGTGYKIKLYNQSTGTFISEYTVLIYGDVNGDGVIDSADQTVVANHTAANPLITNNSFLKAADVDKSGSVSNVDTLKLLQHILKISYIIQ